MRVCCGKYSEQRGNSTSVKIYWALGRSIKVGGIHRAAPRVFCKCRELYTNCEGSANGVHRLYNNVGLAAVRDSHKQLIIYLFSMLSFLFFSFIWCPGRLWFWSFAGSQQKWEDDEFHLNKKAQRSHSINVLKPSIKATTRCGQKVQVSLGLLSASLVVFHIS